LKDLVIIDDDLEVLDLVARLCRNYGFRPRLISCPLEALSYLKTTQGKLVIIDIRLHGLSGVDILRRLGDKHEWIVMSGDFYGSRVPSGIKTLQKPFTNFQLAKCLEV
jgi:DNA-binding response OmpR family regulator